MPFQMQRNLPGPTDRLVLQDCYSSISFSATESQPSGIRTMPPSKAARYGDSFGKCAPAPPQTRDWDNLTSVKFPIGASPTPLPGNGLVRARARIPDSRPSNLPSQADSVVHGKEKSKPSLRSLDLLTPSDAIAPPRTNAARLSGASPGSVSPLASRDWDGSVSVVVPIGSPASPLPEVSPQRDAVTFTLWKILVGHKEFLTSEDFHAGMHSVFPGERYIFVQELWATMARSLGGSVSQDHFQYFFEKIRPDFLFGQHKRYRLLQRHITSTHGLASQPNQQHGPRIDVSKGLALEREVRSVSPPLQQQLQGFKQVLSRDKVPDFPPAAPSTSPRRVPAGVMAFSAPVTPADASARARENLLQNADRTRISQSSDSLGFKAVILRTSSAATSMLSKSKKDDTTSPKKLKAARDTIRLQQYLAWMRKVLPSEDCEGIGDDGSGLCNGLLLYKLIKAVGAPADRLQSLHLQMDQGVRTRRLWLRNMEAIGNCVLACSSSVCVLDPELAVDGDRSALVSLLRLIVQTFVVKKIPKTRVIEWCAAHLQHFNMTLQPQTIQFPHSNASLQQDFSDGLLISLLLQRCIPAAGEAAASEAMLLLQESELHSDSYTNRHVALGLIIILGLPSYFNMQQLDLRPLEHNFLWMQLHAIYLAYSGALPTPTARAAAMEPNFSHSGEDQVIKSSRTSEQDVERKVALLEKRALEARSTELQQSVQRLDSMKRTLRVLTSPKSSNPSEMLQHVVKTQAELQERSQQLEDTSSEIKTVKQALAAVMQQQQEAQNLLQEHGALTVAHGAAASDSDSQSAHTNTIQSFLEKVQQATLIEASYTHRSTLLRAAAAGLLPALDQSSSAMHPSPELLQCIEKAEADLHEMEQFFLEHGGAQSSESSKLLIHAKRLQLQDLLGQSHRRLQPEDLGHIQTLLSSDDSLQDALDREADVAYELQRLKYFESNMLPKRPQHQHQNSASGSKGSRPGLRVQFFDTGRHEEDSDADPQLRIQSAELLAIQRLIRTKQKDGDDDAVRTLKENLLRKQMRTLHVSSKEASTSQFDAAHSAFKDPSNEECFSLMILNKSEGRSGATDALAWRMFWQGLQVHFNAAASCGSLQDSDAASGRVENSVERVMTHIADAMAHSAAQRKFLFLFISCPVLESDPAALQLDNGQRITFERLHEWLGSLCQHECFLVFDTGGSAFAQTAIDASCVKGFSGSMVSGCLGLVDTSVSCCSLHPFHRGIGSDMGLLSFTIIEALLSASTNLRCDELELVLGSISTQRHLHPSIIYTLPFLIPSWVITAQAFRRNSRMIHQSPKAPARHPASRSLQHHSFLLQSVAANSADDRGIASVSQTLETQYPPVSPEAQVSPMQFEAEIESSAPHALLDFSDDDDVPLHAAWIF